MTIQLENAEFNLIWLQNKMPLEQVNNLIEIIAMHPKVTFNIWVDAIETTKLLVSQLGDFSKRVNFKYLAELDEVPEEVRNIIYSSLQANILGGVADIYKLFVLTRLSAKDQVAKRYRYYIEADNLINQEFANKFDGMEFGALYLDNEVDMAKISSIQPDCLFLDAGYDEVGMHKQCQTVFGRIFKDELLQMYFNELLQHAQKNKGLSEVDVMQTYPVLIVAFITSSFMKNKNNSDIFGLNKYLLSMSEMGKSFRTMDRRFKRSWVTVETDKLMPVASGCLSSLIMLRLLELGDPTSLQEMSKSCLDFLSRMFSVKFDTQLALIKYMTFIVKGLNDPKDAGVVSILDKAKSFYSASSFKRKPPLIFNKTTTSGEVPLVSAMDNLKVSASSDAPKKNKNKNNGGWKKGFLL